MWLANPGWREIYKAWERESESSELCLLPYKIPEIEYFYLKNINSLSYDEHVIIYMSKGFVVSVSALYIYT